tara:strand:- start:1360 stop:1887 length:528 start_codon:yes stop_codon:yes gene_type:complete
MSTQWILEIPLMVRVWINDLADSPTYSDDRLQQVIVVAGQYVTREINFDTSYKCDILNLDISPDPSLSSTRDEAFITFVTLKSACLLDQSTFRTKAAGEGIRAGLGAASVSVAGNLKGYKEILDVGPCALYEKLRMEYEIGNANGIKAVLSPFVGNNFDARYLNREHGRSRDFYS